MKRSASAPRLLRGEAPTPEPEPAFSPLDPRAANPQRESLGTGRGQLGLRKERIFERLVEGGSYLALR
jgi:hypothetical protein